MKSEIIICSAVKTEDGQIIRGHRHSDAFTAAKERGLKVGKGHEYQGFITSTNRYVEREEALKIQKKARIKSAYYRGYDEVILFSEDLY